MKKFLAIILCAIMILPAVSITVGAERGTRYGDYLYYEKYYDYIEITDCDTNAVSVDIPAEIDGLPVTSIGSSAFAYCGKLTNVTIPSSVTSIDDWAFDDCNSLTSVTIPESVISIGEYAFYGCESLTSVTIPSSVTSIGDGAFSGCNNITSVTIPDSVKSIGENAFYNTAYYNKESNWHNGVLYIDNCLVNANDKMPSNYTISSGTRLIASCAFFGCDKLTSITIPDSITSIGKSSFSNCGLKSITIPGSVKNIEDNMFGGCIGLIGVTISEGVTSIGDMAFYGCISLKSINIPNSLTSIGEMAFINCDSLTSVTLPDGVISIGKSAFEECDSLTSVTIPNSVISIGNWAFSKCIGLTNITIGNGVTSIGVGAFSDCGSLNISVDSDNKNYSDIDGVLFNKNKTEIIAYAKDEIQPEYTIPNGVTSIGGRAFCYCDSLTSITMPDSVTSIGDSAFAYCDSLTSVIIPNSVTSIGNSEFSDCDSLTNVTIPNSVISIGWGAFDGCKSLTDIYYGGSEEDWQNIYNEDLTGATIHYNSAGPPRIEVPKPVVEGGSITITAETKNIEDEGELFAVGYDGSKLTASEKLQDGAATLPAEDVKTIKVFCWDSLDTMRPLCEPKTITIK